MTFGDAPGGQCAPSTLPRPSLRTARWLVIAISLVALAGKLVLAATTFGTNDIVHWLSFLRAVTNHGPIGVYGVSMPYKVGSHFIQLYNHPPLVGYFLELVRLGGHVGFSPQFMIRASSSLADVVTAVIVFELLRRRRSLREAAAAGILVGASPILVVISGYHGNTDPIFVMLTLLSVYLLVDRQSPVLAGVALACAVGIKIVPVVVIPSLFVYAVTCGIRPLLRFLVGFGGVFLTLWGPALILQGAAVRQNVLGYAGLNSHQWGVDLLTKYAAKPGLMAWIEGGARLGIVAMCALVPAVLVWRHPAAVVSGAALSLCGFLALTPSFGTQYLAWGAAPVFLLTFGGGVAFSLLAGVLLVQVYTRWNGGLPWDHAVASPFSPGENVLGLFTWASLSLAVVPGMRHILEAPRQGGAPMLDGEVAE